MARSQRDDEAFEEDDRRPRRPVQRPESTRRRDEEFEDDPRPRRQRNSRDDREDDEDRRPRRREEEGSSIIPTRNIFALLGYYFAFGSLIVILGTVALVMYRPDLAIQNPAVYAALMFGVGGLLAVIALVFGIVGMIKVSQDPRVKGTAHAIIAMIMGIGEIVALLILLLIGFATRR